MEGKKRVRFQAWQGGAKRSADGENRFVKQGSPFHRRSELGEEEAWRPEALCYCRPGISLLTRENCKTNSDGGIFCELKVMRKYGENYETYSKSHPGLGSKK